MRILVTGHTGFKGSWLCMILNSLGYEVHGIGLDPPKSGIFELASVETICASDIRLDICKKNELDAQMARLQPEVVIHLAAQALVLTSYQKVYETYATNVLGTLNVLDSSLKSNSLKGIVIVTTDKVYEQNGKRLFIETDPLGGRDPYSSSKALADRLTQDWSSRYSMPVGIARAGNVIGGGDVSANRLIPDIFSAIADKRPPTIRNPESVRPWQHVLDCLNGYLKLMDYILDGQSGIFNFGPDLNETHSVEDVVKYMNKSLVLKDWKVSNTSQKSEADFLALDSTKAFNILNWKNKLNFEKSLDLTIEWYYSIESSRDLNKLTLTQVENFFNS